MTLTQNIGDHCILLIPMRWGNRPFVPGTEWTLMFTVKASVDQADSLRVFQKSFPAQGITVVGNVAAVEVLRADTSRAADFPETGDPAFEATAGDYVWGIKAYETAAPNRTRTVASGTLTLVRDVTRLGGLTGPIFVVEDPELLVTGPSAYDSYVSTTSDDPVLSEAAWIASLGSAADPDTVVVASPANDDMIQRVGGSWVTRTIAQIKTALGLGSAAYTASTDYATAAQGTLADSSLQPGDVADAVWGSITGDIADQTDLTPAAIGAEPALGFTPVADNDSRLTDARTPSAHAASHAAGQADEITPAAIGAATAAQGTLADSALQDAAAFATAAQGATADTALQPAALSDHISDTDPHGDRAYTDDQIAAIPAQPLANYAGTAPPAVTDDSSLGYSIGSPWYDNTGLEAYRCVDASAGAAVWIESTFDGVEAAALIAAAVADYLPLAGGTMSGNLQFDDDTGQTGVTWVKSDDSTPASITASGSSIDSQMNFNGASKFYFSAPIWPEAGLIDINNIIAIDTEGRSLADDSSMSSVGWGARELMDTIGTLSARWGDRVLYDSTTAFVDDAYTGASIDWENRNLIDTSGFVGVDWGSRALIDQTGTPTLYWGAADLLGNGCILLGGFFDVTPSPTTKTFTLIFEDSSSVPWLEPSVKFVQNMIDLSDGQIRITPDFRSIVLERRNALDDATFNGYLKAPLNLEADVTWDLPGVSGTFLTADGDGSALTGVIAVSLTDTQAAPLSDDPGTAGQMVFADDYTYRCFASGDWRRVAVTYVDAY